MSYTQLTEYERYQIYTLLTENYSQLDIASHLNRSPSTISREIKRNTGHRGYRPKQAHALALCRRITAHKATKVTGEIYAWIEVLLRQELSPEQVVGYLRRHQGISLHHETVYQIVYEDKKQGGDLWKYLRIASKPYRKRYGQYDRRGKIPNRVGIEKRPAVVDRRNRIGDWECDTVIGKGQKGALLTLVERKTLYTVIVVLLGKQARKLAKAAVKSMQAFKDKVKTITFDNGLEFAEHTTIGDALDAKMYFARPYASWERGINENTNGLIRQYFPKDTDFSQVTQAQVNKVMDRLNNRPRKTRGYKTPNEMFLEQQVDLLAA